MRTIIHAILFTAALVGCNRFSPEFEYIVFHSDSIYADLKPDQYLKNYELIDKEFHQLEEILVTAVKSIPNEEVFYLKEKNLSKFKRQYIAYETTDGRIVVWIYGFCKLLNAPTEVEPGVIELRPWDWKTQIIDPNDTDDCFWRIRINNFPEYDYDLF